MLHTKFIISKLSTLYFLTKKFLKFLVKIKRPLRQGKIWPWGHNLNGLKRDPFIQCYIQITYGLLFSKKLISNVLLFCALRTICRTKHLRTKPGRFSKVFFQVFWGKANFNPETMNLTNFVEVYYTMLHSKYQNSWHCSFWQKDIYFFYI